MAGVSEELLSDDLYRYMLFNQSMQNSLGSGLNIANAGWKTALGLALGTGLGNWLGNKFWNFQKEQREKYKYGDNPAVQAAINNLFGDVDLGWTPQYQFKTPKEYLLDAVKFNPNWRDTAYNNALPKYQAAMTGFLPPRAQTQPQQAIAPAVSPTPQLAPANPPTTPTPQQNYSWDYRPLTEGSLRPKPAMSISEAMDNVLPNYGLTGW